VNPAPHIAIDFETYYDTQLTVKKMGVWEYLSQTPEIYLVTAYDGNGTKLATQPSSFDWSLIHERLVVSHNANFDSQVFRVLQSRGVIPAGVCPAEWNCTANLAAYLGAPRGLDGASHQLLGVEHSKDIRKKMRGKHWDTLPSDLKEAVIQYALRDAELCWKIWNENCSKWPETERYFSLLTLKMCAEGVYLDSWHLEEAREIVFYQKEDAREGIPWTPPLSMAIFRQHCEALGIKPPRSLAMTDEECDAWMEMYRGKYPWVEAMRNYRRCNMLDKKIDKMLSRQRADGRMPYELKYWGSHTGRDSGSGGVNMQNLPHGELYGADLRAAIIAPQGKRLVIADLEQIEARILLTLVKDKDQLALIRTGMSPYEAHCRATMGFSGPVLDKKDPMYRLAKARVLALGYGAGWRKFVVMAYLPMYLGKDAAKVFASPVSTADVAAFAEYLHSYEKDKPTIEKWKTRNEELEREWTNAWLIVREFRSTNYRITAFWKYLDTAVRESVGHEYGVQLPSGRILRYEKVKAGKDGELTAELCRGDKRVRTKIYGGRICENIVQAIARDIFKDACLRVSIATYQIIMRVHDELVCEIPAENAQIYADDIKSLMGISPPWLPNCPVSAEAKVTERYLK
jgi:DNA polymerase